MKFKVVLKEERIICGKNLKPGYVIASGDMPDGVTLEKVMSAVALGKAVFEPIEAQKENGKK